MTNINNFTKVIEDSAGEKKVVLDIKSGAVQIFRPLEKQEKYFEVQKKKSRKKMPHTNIAKLIYAAPTPKNTPTKTKTKTNYHNMKSSRKLFKEKNVGDCKMSTSRSNSAINKIVENKQIVDTKPNLDNNSVECVKNVKDAEPLESQFFAQKVERNETNKNNFVEKIIQDENFNKQQKNPILEKMETIANQTKPEIFHEKQLVENSLKSNKMANITNEIQNGNEITKDNIGVEISPKKSLSTFRVPKLTNKPKENNPQNKKKFYNPEEAKQFIKNQRDKWKAEEKATILNKEKIDKEEIKRRLDELHKNTLKILKTNLKKGKKRSAPKSKQNSGKCSSPIKTRKFNETEKGCISNFLTARSDRSTISKKSDNAKMLDAKKWKYFSKADIKLNEIDSQNRIGLLRKADSSEISFTNIKDYDIAKENEKLESLINSKLNLKSDCLVPYNENDKIVPQGEILDLKFDTLTKQQTEHNNLLQKENQITCNENLLEITDIRKNNSNIADKDLKDIEIQTSLQVPNVKLESRFLRSKSVHVQVPHENNKENISVDKTVNKSDEIPYWLKPTAVEIYPYNFITAVRKKLEALTNPVIQRPQTHQRKNKNLYKTRKSNVYQDTPLSHLKHDKNNVRRRIINNNSSSSNTKHSYSQGFSVNGLNEENGLNSNNEKSNSFSEIVSNFSSISLHVPESNTISDMSSLKSDVASKAEDKQFLSSTKNDNISNKDFSANDDTTISSSVFSSPEKKINFIEVKQPKEAENILSEKTNSISPLSLENITNLQVKSKRSEIKKVIDEDLSIPNLNLKLNLKGKSEQSNDIKSSSQKQEKLLELDQLLNNFNKSLSQVIEVNNQLKNTLDKSQNMLSPNSKRSLNHNLNEIPVLSKPSATSFTTGGDYTSDFEDDASNTTLKSVQLKQNFKNLNNKSISEGNITYEEIKPTKLEKRSAKSEESSKQNVHAVELNPKSKFEVTIEQSLKSDNNVQNITESTITEDISEIAIEESAKNENNNKSENSIRSVQDLHSMKDSKLKNNSEEKLKYLENHINTTRGNDSAFNELPLNGDNIICTNVKTSESEKSTAPPVYSIERKFEKKTQYLDSSIGSEFIAVYNKSDVEISMFLQDDSRSVASEATLNYSSIGMYEQLLQAENLKSEQLTALLKMREKVLIDRTKGQIAWLEIQKEKYKSKGLSERITMIKKKQRAILMKMEKEREEIKRLMNTQGNISSNSSARIKSHHQSSTFLKTYRPKLSDSISNVTIRKGFATTISKSQTGSAKIVRGFDIGGSENLEKILRKREEELKNRRQHVEHLMAWHQRLDKEEQEVFQLEQMLLECNKNNWQILSPHGVDILKPIASEIELKKEKKIAEIEKSLKELQNISVCSKENQNVIDHVRVSGHKLNKLWSRLTGQKLNKFEANKKYKLTKEDLERFYERAKDKVIEEFNREHNLNKLLEQSSNEKISNTDINSDNNRNDIDSILIHSIEIPSLHLNLSSESDTQRSLNSTSIQNIQNYVETEVNEYKLDITRLDITAIEQTEIVTVSSEALLNHQKIILSHELPEELPEKIENLNKLENLQSQKNENTLNNHKTMSENSSSDIRTNISEKMEQLFNQKQYTERSLSNILDETYILKNSSPEIQSSIDEQVPSKSSITELNEISGEIKSSQLSSETIHSEINRPSVIVSLTQKLNVNETKSGSKPVETSSIITKLESENKYTQIFESDSSSKVLKNKTQSPDQSIEIASVSTNNSTKPPSSVSLNEFNSPQTNSSTTIELISPSIDRQTVISKTPTIEEKQTVENSHVEKSLDKSYENSYEYENDFSGSDFTILEDISMPKFETTMDTTRESFITKDLNYANNMEINNSNINDHHIESSNNTTELEKRLIDLDDSLKGLNSTIEKVLSPEGAANSKKGTPSSSSGSTTISPVSVTIAAASIATTKSQSTLLNTVSQHQNNTLSTIISNNPNDYDKITLMPDIISEVEIRRRQKILIESEIKQLEHAMPYVVFREIPNKPPPPYVPPAHGSPMTTIFPPESRIKEITFRRTAELFEEISKKTDKNSEKQNSKESILNENITNIYERIILDICKECMQEYEEILNDLNPESYKNPLALYNPPDRLNCMQEFIYSRVRKLLAMEKKCQRKSSIFSIGRKKRDHIDEILIQELFEEEYKWTNFDQEEDEVKITIVDEILNGVIKDVVIEAVNRNKNIDVTDATKLDLNNKNNVQNENKSLKDA
ncbi:repetitive organellar protein-like [Condylostylus longicornis]|uniref:repetitive organellar protein-like n=1 Tax=Condylostylus longicornis TaxID=2530218 RepID=UPI00244DE389|nr:repetitive organellar protein-like [Condylostylus longicornis]